MNTHAAVKPALATVSPAMCRMMMCCKKHIGHKAACRMR